MLKSLINIFLKKLGYEVKKIPSNKISKGKKLAEGFPAYLQEAENAGIDVNDYINSKLGNPANDLDIILRRELTEIKNPVICELGVGTGRWTREIISLIKNNSNWKIFLVDHSDWIIEFLKAYFKNDKNVLPMLNNGSTLPFPERDFLDMIFCQGMFIELKLSNIVSYADEFNRTLKKNGIAVFNYIDLNTENGWNHLMKQSKIPASCFTYYTTKTIDTIFSNAGFMKFKSVLLGNSTYAYFRKNESI